jgi:hypothetical protein
MTIIYTAATNQATVLMHEMVVTWSKVRQEKKRYKTFPSIELKLETEAYHWVQLFRNKQAFNRDLQSEEELVIYPASTTICSSQDLDRYIALERNTRYLQQPLPPIRAIFFDLYVKNRTQFVTLLHDKVKSFQFSFVGCYISKIELVSRESEVLL